MKIEDEIGPTDWVKWKTLLEMTFILAAILYLVSNTTSKCEDSLYPYPGYPKLEECGHK